MANPQGGGQLIDRHDRRVPAALLKRADVLLTKPGDLGQLLLRQAAFFPDAGRTQASLEAQGFQIGRWLVTADGVLALDLLARKIAFGSHAAPRVFDWADILEYRIDEIQRGYSTIVYQLTLVLRSLDWPTVSMEFISEHIRDQWADTLKVALANWAEGASGHKVK